MAASGQFFEFSVELTPDGDKLIAVHQFDDVTDSLEICGHKPGVGATWAFLVIEVLKELNEKSDTEDGASSR
ncbi:MAG: hypothetical protein H6824_18905 [Planctomycetaceae bacterium]|nr:hypothetical protein [Planctomycetaceae bacterium]